MQGKTREEYLKDCDYVLEYIEKFRIIQGDYFLRALSAKEGEIVEEAPTILAVDHPDFAAAYRKLEELEGMDRSDKFYELPDKCDSLSIFAAIEECVRGRREKLLEDIKSEEKSRLAKEARQAEKESRSVVGQPETSANYAIPAVQANPQAEKTAPKPEVELKPLPKDKESIMKMHDSIIKYIKGMLYKTLKEPYREYTPNFPRVYTFFTGENCPEHATLTPKKVQDMLNKVARYRFPGDEATSKLEKSRINGSADWEMGTKAPAGVKSSIENSVSHRFYRTGTHPSYTPIYFGDLMHSSQFRILDTKAQMLIIDMLDTCNRLYATGRDEGEGFSYTFSQCRVNMSEKWFRQCLSIIVEKGWFKAVKLNGRLHYYPSADWQTMPLSETEVQELLERDENKSKRVAQKKARQMEYAASR